MLSCSNYFNHKKIQLTNVVFLLCWCLESAPKDLHAEEGKDEDEQDEEHQQGVDGGDGVDQALHQVTHR